MNTRHYFAAGNTAQGFVNYFDFIGGKDSFIYILKGGSGTGKSTLMKKVGKHFKDKGQRVEYFYCASDPESLDGVFIPQLSCAVVDGTAPHVTECRIAGVTDEIINLGEYIGAKVRAHKCEIEQLLQQKKHRFDLAAAYLRAAGEIDFADNAILSRTADAGAAKQRACEVVKAVEAQTGQRRKLFLSSLLTSSLPSLNNYQIIGLEGNAFESHLALKEIANYFTAQGLKFTFFSSILNPQNAEALEIGNTLIALSPPQNKMVNDLLGLAKMALTEARELHKKVEAFYFPAMNFDGLDDITKKLIKKIENT